MTTDINIRPATAADCAHLLRLIKELAAYEKLSDQVVATAELLRQNLFGKRPTAEALIAEQDGQAVGFALFYHNFSTFLGQPGLYLEDVYVQPAHRGGGLGKRFFVELARIARERGCGRMEWSVLDWNEPAVNFYRKLGAEPMRGWTVQRLTAAQIAALADGAS